MNFKKSAVAASLSCLALPALALSPSVGDPGLSGHINLGVGAGSAETNFVSETFGVDVSDDQLKSLGEPDDKNITLPAFGFELGWTFANGKTRVFMGDDAYDDFLAFDGRTELALRHDTESAGNFQISGLMSSGETSVYRDPYQSGKRDDTEYTNNGARITWDQMFGSQLELMLEASEVEVDKERSGTTTLGLEEADRKLLERDGDVAKASLGYLFDLGGGHSLRPALGYVDYDLDGDAMSKKGPKIDLAYAYYGDGFTFDLGGSYADLDGDKENPIFGKKNDTKSYSISSVMTFPGAFGWDNWVPNISAIYAKDDSDIDFNTAEGWVASVALFRAF